MVAFCFTTISEPGFQVWPVRTAGTDVELAPRFELNTAMQFTASAGEPAAVKML